MRSILLPLLLFCVGPAALAQSVSITNLGSIITTGIFTPAVSITNGSGQTIQSVCFLYNGHPPQPDHCGTAATSFTVPIMVGNPGDGPATFQAIAKDWLGNILASSTVYSQAIRINGLTNGTGTIPTSGSGIIAPLQWNGHNFGGQCGGVFRVDGRENISPDDTFTNGDCNGGSPGSGQVETTFKSYRVPNGTHELWVTLNGDGMGTQFGGDPFFYGNTFTSSNVTAGTGTIVLTSPQQHWVIQNRPVWLSSTGALPKDNNTSLALLTGYGFGWKTSTTNPTNIVTAASVTNPTISITLNSMPGGLTAGTSLVNIHGFRDSSTASLTGVCDGLYTMATIVSNTFTVNAPNCPTGTWPDAAFSGSGLEVIINPYFANINGNAITLSYTPGGAAITFSTAGSGTGTVSYRMRPGFWATYGGNTNLDQFDLFPVAFAYGTFTTSNGTTSMEAGPNYSYVHLCLTPTATCPSSIANPGFIRRTDESTVAITTGATYTYTDDGGYTGVASVNSSGTITAASPGWGKVQLACVTCDSSAALPNPPPTYVQVENNATFPHFSKTNGILSTYTAGQSYFPSMWWYMDALSDTTYQADPTQRTHYAKLAQDSGLTTFFETATALNPANVDPINTSCAPAVGANDLLLQTINQNTGLTFDYDFEQYSFQAFFMGAVANGTGYNRLSCLTTSATNLAALGDVSMIEGADEVSAKIGDLVPNPTSTIGTTNFPGPIVVSGGTATVTALMNIYAAWNATTGQGAWVFYSGATNTCLNGPHPVLTFSTNASGFTNSYTFATACGNGTYSSSTDAGLQQRYIWSSPYGVNFGGGLGTLACVLPKFVGTADWAYQGWSQVWDAVGNAGSNSSLVSMVSNGSGTNTVTYTAHGLSNGAIVHIMGPNTGTTGLYGVFQITYVDANTFTVPTTAASGTYNAANHGGIDASLNLSVDCNLPNNYFAQVYTAVHAGANFPILHNPLGSLYGTTTAIKNWNDPAIADASSLYHSDQCVQSYGDGCSVWSTIWSVPGGISYTNLNSRAFQSAARRDLVGTIGLLYQKNHLGYTFNPFAGDKPSNLNWRPETMTAALEWDKIIGVSGWKYNWYQSNPPYTYNTAQGLLGGLQAINETWPTHRIWKATALSQHKANADAKYWLQPRGQAPYIQRGIEAGTAVGPNGRSLSLVCTAEAVTPISGTTVSPSPYAQTIDLTGIRYSGGTMYKLIDTGYTSYYVAMPSNPTSEAIDPCASPGLTTTYYAQPSGVPSDLQATPIQAPSPLPFGASQMAVVTSFYPGVTDDDKPTPCTTGCQIYGLKPFWYFSVYADASGNPIASGSPTKIQ